MQRTPVLWGPALVFFAAALWATDAPFRTHLTHELASNFIVLGEHLVSCFIAVPIFLMNWSDLKKLSGKEWAAVVFIGVCGSALASVAFTESFRYVNPSVSIILQKVQPLIAILLAWWLLGETLHRNFWLWTAVALAGAYLVSFPKLAPQTYSGEVFNPNVIGASLALLAALLWGASTVFGKFALRTVAFQTLTSLRFAVGLIFLTLLNAVQGAYPRAGVITGTDVLFIIIIALTSGVFSLFLYYYGLQYTRASIATIAELGFPLAAVFVNAYFIPGNQAPDIYFGLFAGQWVGSAVAFCHTHALARQSGRNGGSISEPDGIVVDSVRSVQDKKITRQSRAPTLHRTTWQQHRQFHMFDRDTTSSIYFVAAAPNQVVWPKSRLPSKSAVGPIAEVSQPNLL